MSGGGSVGQPRSVTLREGDLIWFGSYRGEALLWQVIETDAAGRPLLLCDAVICFKAFDVPAVSSANEGQTDIQKYGSSDWESSSLKRWLNAVDDIEEAYGEKGFLSDGNFTAAQRESIAEPGVFLPSKADLKRASRRGALKKRCCANAPASNDFLVLPRQSVWYWTSTPSNTGRVSVAAVNSSGGFYKTLASDHNTGVCPAFFLDSSAVKTVGGDGSRRAPFFVTEGGAKT